jgi:trimeric autotransporter adhesin
MTTAARRLFLLCLAAVLFGSLAAAQSANSSQSSAVVPRLVNFSGKAVDGGKVITGVAGATFAIYSEESGGSPLWLETQNVTADAKGNYTVQLGATSAEGLPLDLFTSGEARWLGVRVNNNEEQPRVLLLSVPYALKAADAETVGGLPPSAFVLAAPPTANAARAMGGSKAASVTPATSSDVTTTGGTVNTIPLFTTATNVQNSILTQTGTTKVNVGGNLNLPALGRFEIGSKLFAFGSYANENAFLGFAGNTTTTGTYNTASGVLALHSNTTGIENTASGYAALEGNTTAGGNTAFGDGALKSNNGSFNTASGFNSLTSNTTGYFNTASGSGGLYSNTTGYENTASGQDALYGNIGGNNNTATGYSALGSNNGNFNTATGSEALFSNTTASYNTADGYQALYSNTTGTENTATGLSALHSNNTGMQNMASGYAALFSNTTGSSNVAIGYEALYSNTTGDYNTGVGYEAFSGVDTNNGGLTCIGEFCGTGASGISNATAIGAHAKVSASNSLVLGGTGQYAVKVGIGTEKPSNILTVAQGAGHPVSDSWETYSSRRWKTNIQTLPNALAKVQQMRGVSYDLKDSGKHEIGVIAEEVGAVVPELVTYEDNGKDARSVDYSRLTALLIEAVKQQQREIQREKSLLRRQATAIHDLKSELQETRQSVEKIKAQAGAKKPTLVAEEMSAKPQVR